jgi:hypothetical protein
MNMRSKVNQELKRLAKEVALISTKSSGTATTLGGGTKVLSKSFAEDATRNKIQHLEGSDWVEKDEEEKNFRDQNFSSNIIETELEDIHMPYDQINLE